MAHIDLHEALSSAIVQILHELAPDRELAFALSIQYPSESPGRFMNSAPSVFIQLIAPDGVMSPAGQIHLWPLWPVPRNLIEDFLRQTLSYMP